jgi:hypothetical protein
MNIAQRVVSFPFSVRWAWGKASEKPPQERRTEVQHRAYVEAPRYSKQFRLERECANYRSVHFPR